MTDYVINVNGQDHSIQVENDTPLLWILRDTLHLRGTKYGCGIGQCGACTVHLDDKPVRSCSVLISNIGSKKVVTIEGISGKIKSALDKAWETYDVPQCGYCQAGQLMSASAMLDQNPKPTESDIIDAMNGNLCRCGTYNRIKSAIKMASDQI